MKELFHTYRGIMIAITRLTYRHGQAWLEKCPTPLENLQIYHKWLSCIFLPMTQEDCWGLIWWLWIELQVCESMVYVPGKIDNVGRILRTWKACDPTMQTLQRRASRVCNGQTTCHWSYSVCHLALVEKHCKKNRNHFPVAVLLTTLLCNC